MVYEEMERGTVREADIEKKQEWKGGERYRGIKGRERETERETEREREREREGEKERERDVPPPVKRTPLSCDNKLTISSDESV